MSCHSLYEPKSFMDLNGIIEAEPTMRGMTKGTSSTIPILPTTAGLPVQVISGLFELPDLRDKFPLAVHLLADINNDSHLYVKEVGCPLSFGLNLQPCSHYHSVQNLHNNNYRPVTCTYYLNIKRRPWGQNLKIICILVENRQGQGVSTTDQIKPTY